MYLARSEYPGNCKEKQRANETNFSYWWSRVFGLTPL